MTNKFAKDSYWMKSGIYTLLQRVSELIFGFGSFWMIIRILTKEDFGVWVLLLSVLALSEVARLGFVQNAQIKYASGSDEETQSKILKASFFLNFAVTLITVIILAALANLLSELWSAPKLQYLIYMYCIGALIFMPYLQFLVLMQVKLNFRGIFFANFVRLSLFFSAVLFHFITGTSVSLYQLLLYQIIGTTISTLTGYIQVRKVFVLSRKLDFEWVKKLFHFGKYVFGTNLNSMLYGNVDQIMIGALLGTPSVATYNAASRINNFVEVPLSSISTIVFPKTAERIKTDGVAAVRYLYERSVGLMLAFIIPMTIFCLLFPKFIITIIAGHQYSDSIPILQIIILLSILRPYNRQSGVFLDAMGKPRINFITVVISLIINVISNFIFIHFFGLIGAAYGSLIAMVFAITITHIILIKDLSIKPWHSFIYAVRFYKEGFQQGLEILKKRSK